jgi:hypothetical protein
MNTRIARHGFSIVFRCTEHNKSCNHLFFCVWPEHIRFMKLVSYCQSLVFKIKYCTIILYLSIMLHKFNHLLHTHTVQLHRLLVESQLSEWHVLSFCHSYEWQNQFRAEFLSYEWIIVAKGCEQRGEETSRLGVETQKIRYWTEDSAEKQKTTD